MDLRHPESQSRSQACSTHAWDVALPAALRAEPTQVNIFVEVNGTHGTGSTLYLDTLYLDTLYLDTLNLDRRGGNERMATGHALL